MTKILTILMVLFLVPGVFAGIDRDFSPDSVKTNTNVQLTYTSTSTGFNGLEETLPAGFTLVTTGDSLVSMNGNMLRVAWTGTTKTITLKSTIEGTHIFAGTFESTGGDSGAITGESQIVVSGTGSSSGGSSDSGSNVTALIIAAVVIIGAIVLFNKK